jgi:hypothetical protein
LLASCIYDYNPAIFGISGNFLMYEFNQITTYTFA